MAIQGKIYTRKIIAQVLDISERHVRRLTDDGVLEEFSHGNYKLLPAVQGYINHLRAQVSDDDSTSNYNVEKARLTRLKREDAELDLQIKRNELHRSADVEFIMTNMLIAFKAKLETLPHKALPAILGTPDGDDKADRVAEILKTSIGEALNELTGYSPELFDEDSYMAGLDDTAADEVTE